MTRGRPFTSSYISIKSLLTFMAAATTLLIFANISSAKAQEAPTNSEPAICFVPQGTGAKYDGVCDATKTYTFSSGGQGVGFIPAAPGGDFSDDKGNCYIINITDRKWDQKSCDELLSISRMWVNATGLTTTSIGSINWLNRLSFRSPLELKDSVTGASYRTTADIFGNGTTELLNNGGDNNANYLYTLMDSAGKPVIKANGECTGGFVLSLAEDGTDAWLHVVQPVKTSDGTGCRLGSKDVAPGRFDGVGSYRSHDVQIGSWGQELNGTDVSWRNVYSPFFWANKDEISAFDSKSDFKSFVPATGTILDNIKASWTGEVSGSSVISGPSQSARAASGWRFFYTESCSSEKYYLAVASDNAEVYLVDFQDAGQLTIRNIVDEKCIWGREVTGINTGAFNVDEVPFYMAFVDNATKTAAEVADLDLSGTGSTVDPTLPVAEAPDVCTTNGGVLSWIVCPVLDLLDSATQWMEDKVGDFLFVNPAQFDKNTESGKNIYRAWSTFRSIATVIIVIIALIMILSEAMGSGVFDNYSVKKLLPRLLLAGIGIQLSWFAMTQLINVFNIIGDGIGNLMLQPFVLSDGTTHLTTSTNITQLFEFSGLSTGGKGIFAGMVVAGTIALVVGAVALGIAVVAAMFTGFVTLIIRSIIIFLGVVFAPIAIAMSVLPGTQKTSKWWWESFEKALLMYPVVIALLAAGKITGYLLIQSAQTADGLKSLQVIAAIVAWFAPFFFLPKALQATGQALGKVTGFANDKSKGMFDKARGWDKGRKDKRSAYKKQYRQEQRVAGLNSGNPLKAAWSRNRIRAGQGATGAALWMSAKKRDRAKTSIDAVADAAHKKAVQEEGLKFAGMAGPDGEASLVGIANDSTQSAAKRQAAVERLVQLKSADSLGKLNEVGKATLERSINGGKYGDVKEFAPHLLPGNSDVFTKPESAASPEAISKWNKSTLSYAIDQAHASGNTALLDNIATAYDNDSVRKTMGSELTSRIEKARADGKIPPPRTAPTGAGSGGGPAAPTTGPASGGSTSGSAATPTAPTAPSARDRISSATDEEMSNWVTSSGGYDKLSDAELLSIANTRGGDTHAAEAKKVLRDRKILSDAPPKRDTPLP